MRGRLSMPVQPPVKKILDNTAPSLHISEPVLEMVTVGLAELSVCPVIRAPINHSREYTQHMTDQSLKTLLSVLSTQPIQLNEI